MAPRTVLVADDDNVSVHFLPPIISRWGYKVEAVKNGEDALRRLDGPDAPSLALLDWLMPGLTGVQVCEALRRPERTFPYVYVLMLTGRTSEHDCYTAFEAGADDFITKPVNAIDLRARLRAGCRILDLQQNLMNAEAKMRALAKSDELTGLGNRRTGQEVLDREVSLSQSSAKPVSVLMIDIDHFKKINDTYGHPGGDIVLKEAARRIRSVVRDEDILCRYGGEEFLVIAPGCDEASAGALAERIRRRLCEESIMVDGNRIHVTASFGVASMEQATDASTLIREADITLYRAKHAGRNRVEAATQRIESTVLTLPERTTRVGHTRRRKEALDGRMSAIR